MQDTKHLDIYTKPSKLAIHKEDAEHLKSILYWQMIELNAQWDIEKWEKEHFNLATLTPEEAYAFGEYNTLKKLYKQL